MAVTKKRSIQIRKINSLGDLLTNIRDIIKDASNKKESMLLQEEIILRDEMILIGTVAGVTLHGEGL